MEPKPEPESHKEVPATGPGQESMANLRRRLARGGTLLLASRLLTQFFVWASTLLIARFLLPEDYGLMSIGMLLVGLGDLLAEAGIGWALIQKENLEPRDVDEGFTLSLLLALLMYGLLFVLADPLADHVFKAPELPTFLRVLGIHVLLVPFISIPMALLDRNLSMGKQSAIFAGTAVFQAGLVLGLAIAGMGYWALVVGSVARRLVEFVSYTVGSGWRPRLAPLSGRVRGLLSFSIHLSAGTLLWYLYSNVDYAFVGNFTGPEMLGYYALAFQLISLPAEKLTANVNKIAFPTFCRLQDDRARLHNWFMRLLVLIGFLGMPVMVGMALVAEDGLVVILGDHWMPAVVPFQILSVAGLFKIYSGLFPMMFNARGRPDLNFKFSLLCVVLFPICYYVAGSLEGMIGICLVWMTVYPVTVLGLIHATRHVSTVGLADLLGSQRTIVRAVAFMATVVLGVRLGLPDMARAPRLIITIAVGALAYAAPLLLFCRHTVLADLWKLRREVSA